MAPSVSTLRRSALALLLSLAVFAALPSVATAALDTSGPATPTKLIFIHHSTGEAWLSNGNGNLGIGLRDAGYFVSDTNYGWDPDNIGDHTDVGDWWTWFRGPSAAAYTAALYAESGQHSSYSRLATDPLGPNEIVMFKSCFPNSAVGGSPSDAVPAIGANPLAGNGMSDLTVGNAKGVYLDLLNYFAAHEDKLFVLIVSPPLVSSDPQQAANARVLADWLVDPDNGWLKDYAPHNVVAYDYYNVLTGGHHRVYDGVIDHTQGATNLLLYPTSPGDSHPTPAGHQLATGEFVPWLNAAYHAWKAGEDLPAPGVVPAEATSISIYANATTTYIGRTPILYGAVTPPGMIGRNIVVYVKKPGKTFFSYSSNRTVYNNAGSPAWQYKYFFKPGMAKGYYVFKAAVPAWPGFLASMSARTVTIRLR